MVSRAGLPLQVSERRGDDGVVDVLLVCVCV